MPDVTELMTSFITQTQQYLDANRAAIASSLENTSEAQKTIGNVQKVYDAVSADTATVTAAAQAAKLASQTALKAQANALGVDINNQANRLVQLATEKQATDTETLARAKELSRRASVTPGDSILDYVGNQLFGVYDARQKYRASKAVSEELGGQIQETNQIIQSSALTYRALEESVTAASADAATRIAAADATIRSMQVKLEGLKYDSESIYRVTNMQRNAVDAVYQAKNAAFQEENLLLAQKHLQLSQAQFDFAKEEKQLARDARDENKSLEENILENVNIGRASLGLDPYTGLEAKQAIVLFKSGKQDLYEMYQRGQASKLLGNRAVIGVSAADAIKNLSQNPAAEKTLPTIKLPVVSVLNAARDLTAGNRTLDRKDPAAVERDLNKNTNQLIAVQYAKADSSEDNVFNPGDLKQYLGNTKEQVKAPASILVLPLYEKLLQPLADAGADMSSPRLVYAQVFSALKDRKITYTEALQLSQVYRTANEINQAARGLIGFGIVPPNAGKNLNVSLGKFGSVVDITDAVALGRKLNSDLASAEYGAKISESAKTGRSLGIPR